MWIINLIFIVGVPVINVWAFRKNREISAKYRTRGDFKTLFVPFIMLFKKEKADVAGYARRKHFEADFAEQLKKGSLMVLIFLAFNVLSFGIFVKNMMTSPVDSVNTVRRNEIGDAGKDITLIAQGKDLKEVINYEVEARVYTEEEAEKLVSEVYEKLDKVILGDNTSFKDIRTNLNLITSAKEGSVNIKWDIEDHNILSSDGSLINENTDRLNGTPLKLKAKISCGDVMVEKEYDLLIFGMDDSQAYKVRKALEEADKNSRTEGSFSLPETIDGKKVSWSVPEKKDSIWIMFIGVVVTMLMPFLWKEKEKKQQEIRKKKLLEAYPDFVYRLVLYINSGMNILNALKHMSRDSFDEKEDDPLHREVKGCLKEIENGVSLTDAYEKLGQRCELNEYVKLSGLMSSYTRSGNKNVSQSFLDMSEEALMMKSEYLKRKGEVAGTKLLLPMLMLMGIVMVIIMFPAFYTMNI